MLAVVGDVSGKGLRAAMLVSLIIGTLRTYAEQTRDPVRILQGLNRRLCGRLNVQFATCIIIHFAPDGATTIANAGHLAPYLNGRELEICGSLPLGIAEDAEFESIVLTLAVGDRLTLLTDGIVEAQDTQKKLFGFERTRDLLRTRTSAAEIAAAAQSFGQQDDITVLTVRRSLMTPAAQDASPMLWPARSSQAQARRSHPRPA